MYALFKNKIYSHMHQRDICVPTKLLSTYPQMRLMNFLERLREIDGYSTNVSIPMCCTPISQPSSHNRVHICYITCIIQVSIFVRRSFLGSEVLTYQSTFCEWKRYFQTYASYTVFHVREFAANFSCLMSQVKCYIMISPM